MSLSLSVEHPWLDDLSEVEGIFLNVGAVQPSTPEMVNKGFGIYQFMPSISPISGDGFEFSHGETGTVVCYDGSAVKVLFSQSDEQLRDSLSDLLLVLAQLCWVDVVVASKHGDDFVEMAAAALPGNLVNKMNLVSMEDAGIQNHSMMSSEDQAALAEMVAGMNDVSAPGAIPLVTEGSVADGGNALGFELPPSLGDFEPFGSFGDGPLSVAPVVAAAVVEPLAASDGFSLSMVASLDDEQPAKVAGVVAEPVAPVVAVEKVVEPVYSMLPLPEKKAEAGPASAGVEVRINAKPSVRRQGAIFDRSRSAAYADRARLGDKVVVWFDHVDADSDSAVDKRFSPVSRGATAMWNVVDELPAGSAGYDLAPSLAAAMCPDSRSAQVVMMALLLAARQRGGSLHDIAEWVCGGSDVVCGVLAEMGATAGDDAFLGKIKMQLDRLGDAVVIDCINEFADLLWPITLVDVKSWAGAPKAAGEKVARLVFREMPMADKPLSVLLACDALDEGQWGDWLIASARAWVQVVAKSERLRQVQAPVVDGNAEQLKVVRTEVDALFKKLSGTLGMDVKTFRETLLNNAD